MYYYVINGHEEVGFFKSDLAMKDGGSVCYDLTDEFTIIGYSVNEIKIDGLFVDLGVIDDNRQFHSAQQWAENGRAIIKPIEVWTKDDVQELYRKFQYKPLMEYIGGELEPVDFEDLSMIPKMMDENDLPF